MKDVQKWPKWAQGMRDSALKLQLNVGMIAFLFLLFLAHSQKTLQNT